MKKLVIILFVASSITAYCQSGIPLLGEKAPEFEASTTTGDLTFPKDFGNHWKILLSHPKDFTPVCTSEILQLATMQDEFEELGVKLAIISTDDLKTHYQWKQSMEGILKEKSLDIDIQFPLIDDSKVKISNQYGMLHSWENVTRDVRGVFIIDRENRIRTINFYPLSLGRNMEEIKRIVVALQTIEEENVLIPVNWKKGDDVLMTHLPYMEADLRNNPELKDQFYKQGVNLWYKRIKVENP